MSVKESYRDHVEALVKELGFHAKEPVSIKALHARIQEHDTEIKKVLEHAYAGRIPETILSDSDFQSAFVMNLQKMVQFERTRKNDSPYYFHPIEASQELSMHPPEDEEALKIGMIGALLHDYLEEGDLVSRASLKEFREIFPSLSEEDQEGLVMQTEPNYVENGKVENPHLDVYIDYDVLKEQTGLDRKQLEPILFLMMTRANRVSQIVVPVDKLANVGDCDIVQRKKVQKEVSDQNSPEYKNKLLAHLVKTLGTYALYADGCILPDAQKSKSALIAAIEEKVNVLSSEFPYLSEEVKKATKVFRQRFQDPKIRTTLSSQLVPYLQGIGLIDMAKKILAESAIK